jgi:biopolymer transport protein ExbD
MSLLKRRARATGEIPTSSMADIAFLLLIFFLVTTTIDTDTGIGMVLPPPLEDETPPPPIQERNLLNVLVNQHGQVLVDGQYMANIAAIRQEVIRHVTNEGRDPNYSDSPDKAIVSFKTERNAQYAMYINVLDEIRMGYNEIRDSFARELGAPDYVTYRARLQEGAQDQVRERYPLKISIAEPDPGT